VSTTGITIGRSTDASLPALTTRLSRIHAMIKRRGTQIVLDADKAPLVALEVT
jgi:hypothetical protein